MSDITNYQQLAERVRGKYLTQEEVKSILLFLCNEHQKYYDRKQKRSNLDSVIVQTAFLSLFSSGKHFVNALKELKFKENRYLKSLWMYSLNNNNPSRFGVRVSETKSAEERKDGNYHYIPSSIGGFLDIIKHNKRFLKKNFIDVGSGTGSKTFLASMFGNFDKCFGIELNQTTSRISKQLCEDLTGYTFCGDKLLESRFGRDKNKERTIKFYEDNAIEFNYSQFDFIYMYVPIASTKGVKKLYEAILKTAPINAVIIDFSWNITAICDLLMEYSKYKSQKRLLEFFDSGYPRFLVKRKYNKFNLVKGK